MSNIHRRGRKQYFLLSVIILFVLLTDKLFEALGGIFAHIVVTETGALART